MTDTAAPKKSILTALLDELQAIENNFHGLADPQLAIAGKMRELLTEAVNALEMVRADIDKAQAFGAKLESVISQVEDLAKRVAAIEPKQDTSEGAAPAPAAAKA